MSDLPKYPAQHLCDVYLALSGPELEPEKARFVFNWQTRIAYARGTLLSSGERAEIGYWEGRIPAFRVLTSLPHSLDALICDVLEYLAPMLGAEFGAATKKLILVLQGHPPDMSTELDSETRQRLAEQDVAIEIRHG